MIANETDSAMSPSGTRVVSRVMLRVVQLSLASVTWACSNNDSTTSPALLPHVAQRDAASRPNPEVIPGQYIITFADSVRDVPGLAKRIAVQYGNEPMFVYESAIKGFAAQLPDQAIEGLSHNPQIDRIEQDGMVQVASSGTQLSPTWNLDRIDQRNLPLDGQFSYIANGSGVNVYIIDSGIRGTHVEVAGRVGSGYTAINDGVGTDDCNGHGTGVASTAAGTKYGVAKGAQLYPVRVLGCTGSGSYSALIAGIDWVTKNRVLPAVANISIAGSYSSTVNSAVENSINAGVVYAVAAANYSTDACKYSPASAPHALTVAASTRDAVTSTYDVPASYSDYGTCVDLYAPGSAIQAAFNSSDIALTVWSGTSFSSPHVAGVAAIYLSAYPTASPAQVMSAIVGGATADVISGVSTGTANLLLNSNIIGTAPPPPPPPPPADTTTSPAPTTGGSTGVPPAASFSVNGCPKSNCTFDASGSTAANGIASYAWKFGDGTFATSANGTSKVSHSYSAKGQYTVTLTVTDKTGLSASVSQTVVIRK